MNRAVRFTLTAGAVALVCACRSDTLTPPTGRPLASLSDGAHSGNPDFFFLPPIFKNPSSDPNFTPGAFNDGVRPTVEICELGALVAPSLIRPCAATIKTFAPSDVQLDATNQQYQVNWDTKASNLDVTKDYRIRVTLGPNTELGFADVDAVSTGSGLRRIDTGEFIGLVDGRTLPIKFRIEKGAACNGGQCNSKTIDLAQGGFVVFDATGDRVDIPAQQSGRVVTVTVTACPNLDIDIPLFGNCLRASADPPLGATRLSPPATVSLCSIRSFPLPPLHEQQELITLHRKDGEVVQALPHSTDFCGSGTIGRSGDAAPQNFADRGLRALRRAAEWLFKPATLHASNLMFDVGAGGQTDGFSDFQFALPAKMVITSLADQTGTPNAPVASVPAVQVTDALDHPVVGARVHFQITSGTGSSIVPTTGTVTTDGLGRAALTQWTLGAGGVVGGFAVQASGRGIADPRNNGPADGFDPFAPGVFGNAGQDEAQSPVTLGTGHLTFTATAGVADLVIQNLILTPTNPTDLDVIGYEVVVKNVGSAPARHFMTLINLNEVVNGVPGRGIEATSLSSGPPESFVLNPGESVSLFRQRTLELNAGTYQLTEIADANNEVPEGNESNNTVVTPLVVTATGRLLTRPVATSFMFPQGTPLPLTNQNGLSMQAGSGVQLEVRPSEAVTWTANDPTGEVGSVNTTGLLAIVLSSEDPAAASELIVTATGATASDLIKINSFSFDNFPRFTTLIWRPVAGAASYDLQIDFGNGCTAGTAICTLWTPYPLVTTPNTGYVFEFVGAQPGRWRVTARNAAGAIISTSELVYFRYAI